LQREEVYLKLAGRNLISFKKLEDGQIIGTGILNPLLEKLRLFAMLYLQSNFYKNYNNLARWKGKMVTNTFAPPVGSRPQLRALKGLIKSHLLPHASPIAMTFAVTYRCQCKCVHCSAGRHMKKGIKELTTEEAKKVIDDSQKLGVTIMAFTGGEPLLREDLFELISYVDKRKALPIMFTNGQFLNDENIEKLVDAGLYSLFVSIDSPNPEEHDSLRGMPGLYESAIRGLKKMKSKGVMVGISSYATRAATEKGMYKKMHKLAQEVGAQNVILFDGVPTGNMLKNTSIILTPNQREEIRDYSSNIFKKKIIPPLSSQSWQNSVALTLARISPATSFNKITTDLAWTGEQTRINFDKSAKAYQTVLNQSLFNFIFRDISPAGGISMGITEPINFKELPAFQFERSPLPETFKAIVLDVGLMLFFSIFSFVLVYVSFLKYDIR